VGNKKGAKWERVREVWAIGACNTGRGSEKRATSGRMYSIGYYLLKESVL
jgi:hypothetical protein